MVDVKNQLLEMIAEAYQEEVNFTAVLSEAEQTATGTSNEWAIKDVLAHSAAWKVMMSDMLHAAQTNQEPYLYDDLDDHNEMLFQRHRGKSWQEILDFMDMAHRQLSERVQLLDADILVSPDAYPWLKGRALWRRTAHNGYFHPLGHIAFLYRERDEKDRGNQLMEEVTQRLLTLDDSAAWQGQSIYNLACFFALNGEKGKALENLHQCFSLSPGIIEWSRQDKDLESLWDDPAYLALIESAAE